MRGVEQQPVLYDGVVQPLNRLVLDRWRRELFSNLHGDVLELGVGTGLNLQTYGPHAHIAALEIDAQLIRAARGRADAHHVRLVQGNAQHLPFADHSFDYVTSALVFCTIANPAQALQEVARVLRPGGQLVQLEHTRTNHPVIDAVLDTITPVWKRIAGGCHPNRDTVALLHTAGWQLQQHEQHGYGLIRLIRATPRQHQF